MIIVFVRTLVVMRLKPRAEPSIDSVPNKPVLLVSPLVYVVFNSFILPQPEKATL